MIRVHRLTQPDKPIFLNSDQIQTVETTPDTVVTLGNNQKLVIAETAEELVELVWAWRTSLLGQAVSDVAAGRSAAR